jgi:NADH-quinone oxidoreductase subunit N
MNAIILSAILGVVMMFVSVFKPNARTYAPMALVCFILLAVANIVELRGITFFKIGIDGMLRITNFSLLFGTTASVIGLLYVALSGADVERVGSNRADYFALILFIYCGMFTLVSFDNLLMLFLGVEIISIPLYVLAASDKRNLKSNEAGLKYFLMGAFSTGILLLGIALLYGKTGTFTLRMMNLVSQVTTDQGTVNAPNGLVAVGMLFIFCAMAFKASVAPFHFWTPDVYDGSPTVFTSFMSTIVKAAIIVAFMRLFSSDLFGNSYMLFRKWHQFSALLIALTLVVGNITAVFQQSVKRMLAYSSIAQAGFMMFAVVVDSDTSREGILLYTVAYSVATMGIFAVLLHAKDFTLDGFNGLAKRNPLLAAVTTIFLLSLAGIPLTAGFFAKFYMLSSALNGNVYIWIVVLAILCAAISVYYYFRVIQAMYFKPGDAEFVPVSNTTRYALIAASAIVLLVGLYPGLVTGWL